MTKRVMTPEVQRKLSALLPFAPGASVPFTPEAFQKVEEGPKPVFLIGAFSKADIAYLRGHLKAGTFDDAVMVAVLQNSGVKGWSDLPSRPEGETVPYSKEAVADLPDALLGALYTFASELTFGPTEVEKEGLP